MDWDLGRPPRAVRAGLGALAAGATASALAWGATAAADGAWLQAVAAALVLPLVVPAARAAMDRRSQGRLHRDADGRWSDDRLGVVAPPSVQVDGGGWLLLRLRAAAGAGTRATRWVCTDHASAGSAAAWAARRRVVLADAGRPMPGATP